MTLETFLRQHAITTIKELMHRTGLSQQSWNVWHALPRARDNPLQNLPTHLLTWRYDPTQDPRRGWRQTIRNVRREIGKRARGSLQDYPARYLALAYRYACEDAADETDLPLTTFPGNCPWLVDQVLDANFWPEAPARELGPRPHIPRRPRRGPRFGPGTA